MAFLPNIGVPELLIVLVIAVIILGPKRVPAAAKSVGQGMRNFRDSLGGGSDEEKKIEESKVELDKKSESKTEA